MPPLFMYVHIVQCWHILCNVCTPCTCFYLYYQSVQLYRPSAIQKCNFYMFHDLHTKWFGENKNCTFCSKIHQISLSSCRYKSDACTTNISNNKMWKWYKKINCQNLKIRSSLYISTTKSIAALNTCNNHTMLTISVTDLLLT